MPEMVADLPPSEEEHSRLPAMSFLEHLEELRRRIIYSIIAVGVGFMACWKFAEQIYGLIQLPIVKVLRDNGLPDKLVVLGPTDAFNLYLKIGFMMGLFVASPF